MFAIMKRFIYPFVISVLLLSSAFAQGNQRIQNFEDWLTYYYLNPEPDKISLALKEITARGYFENDDAHAPLSGFFTEVFIANPQRIDAWVKPYVGVSKRHILYSALWASNSPQGRAALEQMAKAESPEEAKKIRALLASPPPTLESISISSPAALDYMWGRFMASGSAAPVNRIIDQMKFADSKGNVEAMLIGGAARWSVSANSRQHKKVLEIVKARSKTADPRTKKLLNEILADINVENTKNAR